MVTEGNCPAFYLSWIFAVQGKGQDAVKLTQAWWHIYESVNVVTIGLDNRLLHIQCPGIICANVELLLIRPFKTNSTDSLVEWERFLNIKIPLEIIKKNFMQLYLHSIPNELR